MNTEASRRPVAIWLCSVALALWIVWSLTISLSAVQHGYIAPFQLLIGYGPYLAGLAGFWLMRWWGVVALFFAAVIGVLTSGALPSWITLTLAALTFIPALAIAVFYRSRFRG